MQTTYCCFVCWDCFVFYLKMQNLSAFLCPSFVCAQIITLTESWVDLNICSMYISKNNKHK